VTPRCISPRQPTKRASCVSWSKLARSRRPRIAAEPSRFTTRSTGSPVPRAGTRSRSRRPFWPSSRSARTQTRSTRTGRRRCTVPWRCAAAVEALLDIGADPRATNGKGSTAMQLAHWTTGRGGSGSPKARAQQAEIVRLLRGSGGV
jgi:hypothetical protein